MLDSATHCLTHLLTPRVVQEADLSGLLSAEAAEVAPKAPELLGAALRMLGALGLVLALLIATLWILKRLSGRWMTGESGRVGEGVEVLHQRSLGGRRQLTVVRWEGRRLLLGVTPETISALASEPEEPAEEGDKEFRTELVEALGEARGRILQTGSKG